MNVVKEDMDRVGVVEAVEAKGEGERGFVLATLEGSSQEEEKILLWALNRLVNIKNLHISTVSPVRIKSLQFY